MSRLFVFLMAGHSYLLKNSSAVELLIVGDYYFLDDRFSSLRLKNKKVDAITKPRSVDPITLRCSEAMLSH